MYFPHGSYPKGQKGFNVIKMTPGMFDDGLELKDFAETLGVRANDFFDSQQFLYSSSFQDNYGAKLVMLLSAIERSGGTWRSLSDVLLSNKFTDGLRKSKNGKQALQILKDRINEYLEKFGSVRSVVKFYRENLSKDEKLRIVKSIKLAHTYKKKRSGDFTVFEPVSPKQMPLSTTKEIDTQLGYVLRYLVYDIRNSFVHQASYIPFPDRKYLEDKKIFQFERRKEGLPKESWVITMPFENLHDLTTKAFVRFWRKEYKSLKS